jgi:hypothetical protein
MWVDNNSSLLLSNIDILVTVNLSYVYIYIYIYISYKLILHIVTGTVMAVNVWWLDLHLPMQSVHITIDVVGSTPGEMHNIM